MTSASDELARLNRPRTLVRAARIGLSHYRREKELAAILQVTPQGEAIIAKLLAAEHLIEDTRRAGDRSYSPLAHIRVLTALMAEAMLAGLMGGGTNRLAS